MSILKDLVPWDNDNLNEVLDVLDVGLQELKTEVDDFTDLMDADRVPKQFIDELWETVGLPRVQGLSEPDRRAVLAAVGTAFHYKGARHGLALVTRALWRYHEIVETFAPILAAAKADGTPPADNTQAEWEAWLTANGYTTTDLMEIVIKVELTISDSREYAEEQAIVYRQLLDQLKQDSGYENLLRTFRPGFDASMSTLLGTSQFDGVSLTGAYLLYGSSTAFLDPDSQAILDALKWNVYPDLKQEQTFQVLNHFIPFITHITYQTLGYKNDDNMLIGASESLTVTSGSGTLYSSP